MLTSMDVLATLFIGLVGLVVLAGLVFLWAIPFWLMATNSRNASPLAADTFYEEFERQLAILEGKPDPLSS